MEIDIFYGSSMEKEQEKCKICAGRTNIKICSNIIENGNCPYKKLNKKEEK